VKHVFWTIAAVLHLGSAISFFVVSPLAAAVCFLGGQFVLALSVLYQLNRAFILRDIRFFFVIMCMLYGGALPILTLIGYGDMQGVTADSPGIVPMTVLVGTGLLGFTLGQLLWPVPWNEPDYHARRRSYRIAGLMGLALIVISIISFALSLGATFTLTIDRSQRIFLNPENASVNIQFWVVGILIMQGAFMYWIWVWNDLPAPSKTAVLICLIAIAAFLVLMGSRRDILVVILFAAAVMSSRMKAKMSWRLAALLLSITLVFFIVGAVRQRTVEVAMERDFEDEVSLNLQNNEFFIPTQNLIYYLNSESGWNFRFGATYLYWPAYFVPRTLWPGKPIALSWQVIEDTGQGAPAYTPLVEAYINFAWMGPFIVMFGLSCLLNWMVKGIRRHPLIVFICFATVVDFNRGEFGTTIYQLTFNGLGYALMFVLSESRLGMLKRQKRAWA
jgi:oligosaccharide repeat unit polymerase